MCCKSGRFTLAVCLHTPKLIGLCTMLCMLGFSLVKWYTPSFAMLCCVIQLYVVLCCGFKYLVMLCNVVKCWSVCTVFSCVVKCCLLLYLVVQCYAVMYSVMPCCLLLCCVMQYYAVQWVFFLPATKLAHLSQLSRGGGGGFKDFF